MKYPQEPKETTNSERWETWALAIQADIENLVTHLIRERFPHVLSFTGEYSERRFSITTIGYDKRTSLPSEQHGTGE